MKSRPAPPRGDFPSATGKTLGEILNLANSRAELVVSPAAMVFHPGRNRFPFGVFQLDHTPITDAQVALYIAKAPPVKKANKGAAPSGGGAKGEEEAKQAAEKARREAFAAPAMGPFPASIESLATKPAFRAKTTTGDPDAASLVYATNIDFPIDGEWRVVALVKKGGEFAATLMPSAVVGEFKHVPRVGERAPLIHTPTASEAGGDLSKITTRIPPDTQNRVDYADVLGKEPIILLFATPQFCQSRVCGPVVDVAEQVKQLYGDKAAFIHMEIYKDNEPPKTRPQVRAFHLPTEPWLFAIDRHGIIRAAVEGAFGVNKLTRVVRAVTGE
ncbi:MAG: hypothetical protein WBM00_09240 [Solirubrobacterales bacterium]